MGPEVQEKEAILYRELPFKAAQCFVCPEQCIVEQGGQGFCRVRKNAQGKLYATHYGRVSFVQAEPIEKKPLFHFYPGAQVLSLGSIGCNLRCPGCQNGEVSYRWSRNGGTPLIDLSPQAAADLAGRLGCRGICWTYNEPTVWLEYVLDAAKAAREQDLRTILVSNGYMTEEALDRIGPHLDALRVDIKGFSADTYRAVTGRPAIGHVLAIARRAKEQWDLHVECVTNLIPGVNDSEREIRSLAAWIVRALGEETPWHLTRFYPNLKLVHIPATPIETLEQARAVGYQEGLRYVYLGNALFREGENTSCYACGALLIRREGYVVEHYLQGGRCPVCDAAVPGRWGGIP
jgi:pyruvate formate lyase activating enzyme